MSQEVKILTTNHNSLSWIPTGFLKLSPGLHRYSLILTGMATQTEEIRNRINCVLIYSYYIQINTKPSMILPFKQLFL